MLPILRRRWRKADITSWSYRPLSSLSPSSTDAKSLSTVPRPKVPLSHYQVRQSFIDYFVNSHDHQFVRSSPVKPSANDQSLLFVNAGMNQFKPIFLDQIGTDPAFDHFAALKRVANSQKCIRVGGKHCDLENVGSDFTHHTFFEMLGNWSFNDYFKKEACQMAWSLLTQVYAIDPSRLIVTIFGGDPSLGLPPDLEAFEVWRQIGVPAHRIVPLGMKDNFWEMGETGPCGICTEIHYQLHPLTAQPGDPSYQAQLEASCFEIWNIVFMQYFRDGEGKLHRLEKNYVDTGMGLERILSLVQGVSNNYETDLFTPYFERIEKICKWPAYSRLLDSPKDVAYRILADHSRMASIAIADGVVPDDRGAGYLLRRVLRRAIDSLRTVSELHGPLPAGVTESAVLCGLAETVVDSLSAAFPELSENADRIFAVIGEEVNLYSTALLRNEQLMKLSEGLAISLGSNATENSAQIVVKIEDVFQRVTQHRETLLEGPGPTVQQGEIDRLRREYNQLVELSTAVESISGRFGLTSPEIASAYERLDLNLVELETTVDRILEETIAQFEVEAKRRITSKGVASTLSLSNDCITGRSMDFFLLKAAADLFGTDRPLAVLLKQIPQTEEEFLPQGSTTILQLTVPGEFQSQLEAQSWFDASLARLDDELRTKVDFFPMKNKRIKRIVRFRIRLKENTAEKVTLETVEGALKSAIEEVATEKFEAL